MEPHKDLGTRFEEKRFPFWYCFDQEKCRISVSMTSKGKLKAVDFFCGAGGLTYGLRKAGIKVLAGIDYDESCKSTYEINNENTIFINRDIRTYEPKSVEKTLLIKKSD